MIKRRITVTEVSYNVYISTGSYHAIFSEVLGIKRVATEFIPNFDETPHLTEVAE